jgi:uncharacterized membrane protein
MDNRILVGCIIGLVFASSRYIWNSEKMSKTQKTVLLILLVFPPAQWIGLLFVEIFNHHNLNHTPEKIVERESEESLSNFNTAIVNLKDLKNKGIITENEYNNKIDKIHQDILTIELKNSQEYKQLKSLFGQGILSKEEFDEKVEFLNSFEFKQSKKDDNTENHLLKDEKKSTINNVEIEVWHKLTNYDKRIGKIFIYEISSNKSILNKIEFYKQVSENKYFFKNEDPIHFYNSIEDLIFENFKININIKKNSFR